MAESFAAGLTSKDSLGGVALPLMGVADPLLEYVVTTGMTLLAVGMASVMGVADSLAEIMVVTDVLELIGGVTGSLIGVTEMLELDVGVATIVMGVADVVTTNSDVTSVLDGIMGVVIVELLIGGSSLLLQMGVATVALLQVGGAAVVL